MISFTDYNLIESEARIPILKKMFIENMNKIAKATGHPTAVNIDDFWTSLFHFAVLADPTPKKIYLQWILKGLEKQLKDPRPEEKQYLFRFHEDYNAVRTDLTLFDQGKAGFPPEMRDIGRFKTIGMLREFIDTLRGEINKSQRQIKREEVARLKTQIKHIYSGPEGDVYQPLTEEASQYLGRGTKWCTAATETKSLFDNYNKKGPLFDLIFKDGTKWQFHFETHQFMNELDRPTIMHPRATGLVQAAYPAMIEAVFRFEIDAMETNNLSSISTSIFDITNHFLKPYNYPLPKVFEDFCAKRSASTALFYALYTKKAFPAGEKLIGSDAYTAYMYAVSVIRKRVPALESTILKVPLMTQHRDINKYDFDALNYFVVLFDARQRWQELESKLYMTLIAQKDWPGKIFLCNKTLTYAGRSRFVPKMLAEAFAKAIISLDIDAGGNSNRAEYLIHLAELTGHLWEGEPLAIINRSKYADLYQRVVKGGKSGIWN